MTESWLTDSALATELGVEVPKGMKLVGFYLYEYRPYGAPGATDRRVVIVDNARDKEGYAGWDYVDVIRWFRTRKETIELYPVFKEDKDDRNSSNGGHA
jgi:hypothetical protein